MDFFKELVYRYPLIDQITPDAKIFRVEKRKFVFFWRELIDKQNVEFALNETKSMLEHLGVQGGRTIVIVAKTKDSFQKTELVYFDGAKTLVVFYLIDEQEKRVYTDDSWISFLGLNYKKIVRRIDEIVKNLLLEKNSFNNTNF